MKKTMRYAVCLVLGAALGIGCFLLAGLFTGGENAHEALSGKREDIAAIAVPNEGGYSNSDLVRLAYSVVLCLREADYETLSGLVNPDYGLVLSPYANVNLGSARCLTPEQVVDIGRDREVYVWGTEDGTGEPIQMTPEEYFAAYVYDADYYGAPVITVNRIAKSGNSLENVQTVFPEGLFVDFYMPPSEEGGLDWRLLRLVFEDCGGGLKLSALIHSQYTV